MTQPLPPVLGGVAPYLGVSNAGKARFQGLEFEGNALHLHRDDHVYQMAAERV